ncbi:MAG: hypothetical protein RLZZ621_2398 [Gemmatimonadota bacterium]
MHGLVVFSHRVGIALLVSSLLACAGTETVAKPDPPPAVVATRIDITGAPAVPVASLGETVQLTAVVIDQKGAPMPGAALEWSSSNVAVATVSTTGVVTSVGNGTATITAKSGVLSGRADLTIRQVVTALRVSADSVRFVSLTDTASLKAIAVDARGAPVADASGFTWTSADATIATVSSSGLVRSVANGASVVSVTLGTMTARATVRVQQVVARVEIAQRLSLLSALGSTVRLTATSRDAKQQVAPGGPTWTSLSPATLAVNADGVVTARGVGTGMIAAVAGGVADTAFVRVGDPLRLVLKQEKIHEFIDATQMPSYVYAGVTYPGGPVSYFAQGFGTFDLWQDGRPDFFVPLNKAYGSGIDTRVKPLFFRNDGGSVVHASDDVTLPAIAGVRRLAELSFSGDPFRGLFGIAHDTHDGKMADAVLLAAGAAPRDATNLLDPFPLGAAYGRPTAVNAHSMGAGDLNGDGRTDFAVGDWGDFGNKCKGCKPFFLMQTAGARWSVRQDDVFNDITYNQPMINAGVGEGRNLLIDLHVADLNGDRLGDLVAGYGHGSTASMVFFNQGDARFSRAAAVRLPDPPFGVDNSMHLRTYSRDLNGDQVLDLVVLYSRYVPYYAGYALQILINDGTGRFRDETSSRLRSIADREAKVERLSWSDNFHFIDVTGDGRVDLIGGHSGVVRLWINNGSGTFTEVPVETEGFQNGAHPLGWVDIGGGRFGTLAFRTSWTDAKGSATRVWFSTYEFDRAIR